MAELPSQNHRTSATVVLEVSIDSAQSTHHCPPHAHASSASTHRVEVASSLN